MICEDKRVWYGMGRKNIIEQHHRVNKRYGERQNGQLKKKLLKKYTTVRITKLRTVICIWTHTKKNYFFYESVFNTKSYDIILDVRAVRTYYSV